ncbi:Uncharacterized protein TPAR_03855 [Tolypocladium paradoxum]|uniref:Uncharacterized protein n=1 Tax=Tolypocladium paradoxum TaxID=94208 RepID=A0A2S4L0H3_9HYPO|nr:Uncharacterized protein TPAR_03855 [Tolypocladium paradoxum]
MVGSLVVDSCRRLDVASGDRRRRQTTSVEAEAKAQAGEASRGQRLEKYTAGAARGRQRDGEQGRPRRDRGGVEKEGDCAPSFVAGVDICKVRSGELHAAADVPAIAEKAARKPRLPLIPWAATTRRQLEA